MRAIKRITCMILVIAMMLSGISLTAMATGEINQNDTENTTGQNGITRAEWLKKLTTLFEMTVEDDNYPDNYFNDLDSSSEYYYDMLLAVQFGLVDIEAGGNINPEGLTTREFAAHTLNFCLAYQLEEETEYTFIDVEEVEYPDDVQIAINLGWMELEDGKFLPDEYVTSEEVDTMMSFAEEAWKSTEVDENHENIYDFAEGVIVVPETTVVEIDENQTVTISECPQEIVKGDMFAVYQNGIPCTYEAYSITETDGQLIIQTKDVALEEAFDEVDAQGIIDAEAIQIEEVEGLTYTYDEEYVESESDNANARAIVNLSKIKNFNVSGKLKLKNGNSISVKHKFKNAKIEYKVSKDQVFLKFEGDSELSYELEADLFEALNCEEITILPATVPGIGGFDIILEVELGGAISGTTKGHLVTGVAYSSSGARLIKNFEVTGFTLEAEVSGAIGVKARLGVTGKLVPVNGYMWAKAGGKASFKQSNYNDGNTPDKCTTFAAWVYASCGATVKFELFGFLDSLSFSKEYVFYDEDNSPVRVYHHYEDGKEVCECSRGNWDGYYTLGTSRYHGSGWSSGMGAYGYDSEGNKIQIYDYTLDENENATITAYYGNADVLYIPEKIDGYTVVGIGSNVFKGNTILNSVNIPDSVISIGGSAFEGCSNLMNANLPSELQSIGSWAFRNCVSLKTINVPKTITNVDTYGANWRYPFSGCSGLETLSFDEGITSIPACLFGKTGLKKVVMPDTVTSVGQRCFADCSKLVDVQLSENLAAIGNYAFVNCTSIAAIKIPKTITSVDTYGENWCYPFKGCTNLKEVSFTEGITNIPYALFGGCSGLETITIPDTVTSINGRSFADCTGLKSVEIPSGVTSIGGAAFINCKSLSDIDLPLKLESIGSWAFKNCTSIKTIVVPKTLTNVDTYGANWRYPFSGCTGVETILFEEGMTAIPNALFGGCQGNNIELVIPEGITKIGTRSFIGCTNLKSVVFPNSLQSIGQLAFSKTGLTEVVMPNSINSIGITAFAECTSLKCVILSDALSNVSESMFSGCESMESITLPSAITKINSSAFKNCVSLNEINWNDSITTINASAFQNCDALETLEVPNTVKTIADSVFYDCDGLTKVTIPDSVTSFGTKVFYDCDSLTDISLGTGITSIPESTFEHCDVLESIVLPYRVASIGKNVFKDCVKFTEITIPRKTDTINATAFSYPAQLTIYGVSGTYAETFANDNNITFVDKSVPATEVTLNKEELTLNKGASVVLSMVVTPADFTDEVSWKSTDTSVATIAEDGTVKAVGIGEATIKLIVGDVSTMCKVTVVQPVTSISLNKTSVTLEALDTYQLTATVKPDTAVNKDIKWTSSDDSVAKVDGNGLVTAYKKGTATITVTAQDGSNVTNKCTVTVSSSALIVETVEELESKHNYDNNFSDFWVYTEEGATELKVTFDEQTNIEDGFDFLYIYDGEANEIGKYTGKELAGQTITVPGDTIRIKLVSDESGNEWGFKVIKIQKPAPKIIATGFSGDTEWSLTEDGVIIFTGEGVMKNYQSKSEMPWYQYLDQIKSVVIEDGVTRIGDYSFYGMTELTSVTIPDSVTAIGEYAFKNAVALDNVVLPEGLTKLGESAFYACTSLTGIEIPASLWTVQPYTFKNCTALTEVTFNEGNLQKISDGAFYNTGLTEVVLPDCLDILDTYTFKNCSNLADIIIGNGLTELREAVFYGTAISTIEIPEGIAKIRPYAFKNCVNLETVSLPSTLTLVDEASFYACTSLQEVDFPDAVTTIGNYAFRRCTGLTSVTFGEELVTIGECSFYGCTGITEIVIPDKVTGIEPYAFKGCTKLKDVTLGESVANIKESAFHTCTALKTLVFPASVATIGDYCFSGSYNLWKLTFEGDAPAIGTGAFKGLVATVYYPEGNTTWTDAKMQNYGGDVSWKAN